MRRWSNASAAFAAVTWIAGSGDGDGVGMVEWLMCWAAALLGGGHNLTWR